MRAFVAGCVVIVVGAFLTGLSMAATWLRYFAGPERLDH